MHRTLWAAVAAAGFVITSGCSMCASYLDYDYPAYGGRWCWEADDCCRAGSAFCQAHHNVEYDGEHGGPFAPTPAAPPIHDPVPELPPGPTAPPPSGELPAPPPRTDLSPPKDLTPPSDLTPPTPATPPDPITPPGDRTPPGTLPDTGLPPIEDLDLPPLRDLDLPPLDIDGAVPDLPPRGN